MSGFDLAWLDLRAPADAAARDAGLLSAAAAWLDASARPMAVDLGCGAGATAAAVRPHLKRAATWRLVDHDLSLLEVAGQRLHGACPVELVAADLSEVSELPFEAGALVTASALLDLVSEAWLAALTVRLGAGGCALYAALSYDGVMAWEAAHPLDDPVTREFNLHQRRDKGFGPALGPDATDAAARHLRRLGFTVAVAPSPWRLGAGQAALQRNLIEGVAGAAAAIGALEPGALEGWRRARMDLAGRSGCTIGHHDLLALPPPRKSQSNSTSEPRA